jgi:alpha-mannosidase
MRSIRLHPVRGKKSLPASASLCQVGPANVMLTAFKDADDGRGAIIRLRETAGKDTVAAIKIALPGAKKATLCDLVERDRGPAEFSNGELKVPVKADSMAAVRVE